MDMPRSWRTGTWPGLMGITLSSHQNFTILAPNFFAVVILVVAFFALMILKRK